MRNSFFSISFFLYLSVRPGPLTEELVTEFTNAISDTKFKPDTDQVLRALRTSTLADKYPIHGYVGAGGGGMVFIADESKDKPLAFKLMKDSKGYPNCKDNLILKELNDDDVIYVNRYVAHEEIRFKYEGELRFWCALVTERGKQDLYSPLFADKDPKKHWPEIFSMVGKIILAHAEINFKERILHGDIKPENIILIERNGEYEPAVIDFDLKLDYLNSKANDCQARYTDTYRAPELRVKCEVDEKYDSDFWKKNCESYFYSKNFLEDAYALAQTIKDFLEINADNVTRDPKYFNMSTSLVNNGLANVKKRYTTLQMAEEYEEIRTRYGLEGPWFEKFKQRLNRLKKEESNKCLIV